MSAMGELRRKDRQLGPAEARACLARNLFGRVGTASADGQPYVTPMNYVYDPERESIILHTYAGTGHLMANMEANPRVCFEVDEPGEVIATGAYGCNTSQVYTSVICFGTVRFVSERAEKARLAQAFVDRYVKQLMPERQYNPELNLLDRIAVMEIRIDVMTGKQRPVPGPAGHTGRQRGGSPRRARRTIPSPAPALPGRRRSGFLPGSRPG